MNPRFIIPQGPTFSGKLSYPGLAVFVAGAFLLAIGIGELEFGVWFRFSAGVFLIITGIQMFVSVSGVIIDKQQMRLKQYVYVFFRIGIWKDISDYTKFSIESFEESETGGIRSAFITVHTRYTDLYLMHKSQSDQILLKSCSSRNYAEELKEDVRKYLSLDVRIDQDKDF